MRTSSSEASPTEKETRLKRRWFQLRRIDLSTSPYLGAARELCDSAKQRRQSGDPLDYTETTLRYVLLRQHTTRFQLTPRQLRKLHRDDLGYLAGVQNPNPLELAATTVDPAFHHMSRAEQEMKVVENAQRAERELLRRDRYKAPLIASAVGAIIGGLVVAGVALREVSDDDVAPASTTTFTTTPTTATTPPSPTTVP